ncbi:hypothetical protein MHU86_16412 [Fragilaria crotonensis]|nr:hypothetical protein MHU86_16412 [Fragilaria crotonensis]
MAPAINPTAGIDKWTEYYSRNRNDGGPIQALFDMNSKTLARKVEGNLNNVGRLTDYITGSSYGNMVLIPGRPGQMQLVHHGFACNTTDGFALAFAHGNLGDCTTFKTVPRDEMVAPIAGRDDDDEEGDERRRSAPTLDSMLGAQSGEEFAALEPEGNNILERLPNHCFITPETFLQVKGAKLLAAKDLAFHIIEKFQQSVEDDDEISVEKEEEASGLEGILATLWASARGMLKEIRMDDVPEDPMMSHIIKDVRRRIGGGRGTVATPSDVAPAVAGGATEIMALSSQAMVSLLSKFQEGNEADRQKKESDKSILRTMGPTQRALFTALCTSSMSREPAMSDFMINLTTSKSPQKAINLLLSETRDWEGTFSEGSLHKMLSHGFLSPDANRANPGGFTLFMFYPKTADIGGKALGGKGSTELLREYLGMDVEESTLDYYMKQGFYTPSTPNDLRIVLRTALDMLQLLTCDNTIAGRGLAHVLDPRRWGRMTTILNDRFSTEPEFGAKFCYTLDRHLQTFFDKMTRWGDDVAEEGQPRYLMAKADELIERLEDGQGLNIVLPAALRASKHESTPTKRRAANEPKTATPKKTKRTEAAEAIDDTDPNATHVNNEIVTDWQLPSGVSYLDLFNAKMPGLKGWPVLLDTRISKKQSRTRKAPMCVKFQVSGHCKQGCSLAHVAASAMPADSRSKANALFKAVYASS